MQFSQDQLLQAIQKAHDAGDVAAAQELGNVYKQQQAQANQAAQHSIQGPGPFENQQPGTDGAFGYSIDRAQQMYGSGVEALGRATGIQGMEDYGREVAEKQEQDIAEGGYITKYPDNFENIYKKEGIGGVIKALPTKMAENAATSGGALVGTAVTTAAAVMGAPAWLIGALGGGTVLNSYMLGTGEVTQEQKEKLGDFDSAVSLGGGAIIALLDRIGARNAIPKSKLINMSVEEVAAELAKQGKRGAANKFLRAVGGEAITETAQEATSMGLTAAQGGEYTEDEVRGRFIDAAILGGSMGGSFNATGQALGAGSKALGSLGGETYTTEDPEAAASFAMMLKEIADANNLDLNDLDKMSTGGARQAVDTAHVQLTETLSRLFKDLKDRVRVEDRDSLELVERKVMAEAGRREARNKTKNKVGKQEMDALDSLAGDTKEGSEALRVMRMLNELTNVHNAGYQGGVGRITDQFSIFGSNIGYDKSIVNTERVLRPLISLSSGVATGGASVLGQTAIAGIGRIIDKVTGNRSKVANYIEQNTGNEGIPGGAGPSLREARRQALLAEEEAAEQARIDQERAAEEKAAAEAAAQEARDEANRRRVQQGAPANPESPQGTVENGTGLDRAGVAQILRILKANPNTPAQTLQVIEQYERSVDTGGPVDDFGLIRDINGFLEQYPQYQSLRVAEPNSRGPGGQPAGPTLSQRETNYERGIRNNRELAKNLLQALLDSDISPIQKAILTEALSELTYNLGVDPIASVGRILNRLESRGIDQDAIDTYIAPYAERVINQQNARQSLDAARQEQQVNESIPVPNVALPGNPDARRTQRDNTTATARKAINYLNVRNPDAQGPSLDFGAGFGTNAAELNIDNTYEPFPQRGFTPDFTDPNTIPDNTYSKIISTNVMNVIPPRERAEALQTIGRALTPGGEAVVQTWSLSSWKQGAAVGNKTMSDLEENAYTTPDGTYQKGYEQKEFQAYVQDILGPEFTVEPIPGAIGINGTKVLIKKGSSTVNESVDPDVPVLTDIGSPNIIPISNGTESTPKLSGKTEVATYLQERALDRLGGTPRDLTSEADRDAIADDMVAEAIFEMENMDDAMEWYDSTIAKTVAMMSVKHPELNFDPDAKTALLVAIAITSQNLAVPENLKYGEEVYAHFKKTGRFLEKKYGSKGGAVKKNLEKANALLDALGSMEAMRDFLETKFTVRELDPILQEHLGKKSKQINGENMDTEVYGAQIFGPKIGNGFYTNLRGDFSPVTIDMWFMRTVGRLQGKVLAFDQAKFDKQLLRLKTALGRKRMSDEALIKKARELKAQHERDFKKYRKEYDSGKRKKSEATNAAEQIMISLKGTRDVPASGAERQQLRDIVNRAVAKFEAETGIAIPPASFQALIWYPEQDLYKNLGVKLKSTRQDYASSTRKLLLEEGYNEKDLDNAVARIRGGSEQGPGPARPGTGTAVTETNESASPSPGPALLQQEEQVEPQQGDMFATGLSPAHTEFSPATPEAIQEALPEAEDIVEYISIGGEGRYKDGIRDVSDLMRIATAVNASVIIHESMQSYQDAYGEKTISNGFFQSNPYSKVMSEVERTVNIPDFNVAQDDVGNFRPYIDWLSTFAHEVGHAIESFVTDKMRSVAHENFLSGSMHVENAHPKSKKGRNQEGERSVEVIPLGSFRMGLANILHIAREGVMPRTFAERDTPTTVAKKDQATSGEVFWDIDVERAKKIVKELDTLQQDWIRSTTGIAVGSTAVRPSPESLFRAWKDKTPDASPELQELQKQFFERYMKSPATLGHRQYTKQVAELATDPIWAYMINPNYMKANYPELSRLLQDWFKQADAPVRFEANGFVTILAVVLAMMAAAADEDEERNNPGALSMAPGPLSA